MNADQRFGAGDSYRLAAQDSRVSIVDASEADWLDFSKAATGINLNLGLARGQSQSIGGGNMLHLRGKIENVLGTDFNDRIFGNAAANILIGGAGDDELHGRNGRDVL